jgi:hypothetical protein
MLMPVEMIRSYYGDGVAMYYEFMNFFLRWMTIPAIFGFATWVCNWTIFEDPSKSPMSAVFSIGMSIWASLFMINWSKHQMSLACLWDNMFQNERNLEPIRTEFVGKPTHNPITEKIEPDYPASSRYMRYLESLLVCIPMFLIVLVFLWVAYNVTGVIVEEGKYD